MRKHEREIFTKIFIHKVINLSRKLLVTSTIFYHMLNNHHFLTYS
ncbi:hypothetical protein XBI1_550007 [Xenorhabdus bovienii str. Intermedium]|uniref:Uncharacterized protein n=1 Tax=Xenorhabdus bovienii str. Intermedium TaxID=1379677 RepID=A0A077QML0_XENBV|nr:hypothetical protein XBI1_550007 [Xenorhabdus bovienii str. Intermedium]